MYIADKGGIVTGVDVNSTRMEVCKSLVDKYKKTNKVKLVVQDGTAFKGEELFDKVLVDAECSHDGSIKHLLKFIEKQEYLLNKKQEKLSKKEEKRREKQRQKNLKFSKKNEFGENDFNERFLNQDRLDSIMELQYDLLCTGYRNLKKGGVLVYSTCSFSKYQNEDMRILIIYPKKIFIAINHQKIFFHLKKSHIIQKFLNQHKDECEQLSPFSDTDIKNGNLQPGFMEKTIRFIPKINLSSGMFVAKIRKF